MSHGSLAGTTCGLPALASQTRVAGAGRRVALRHGDAPAPLGPAREAADLSPALVAITQTSILGDRLRRISPREAARLQGLPEWFDFGDQPDAATYKQMGNGVNVGAAYHVFREHVLETIEHVSKRSPELARAVAQAIRVPDAAVERHWDPSGRYHCAPARRRRECREVADAG